MDTVRQGSRGESVKQLQQALGLLADGIFGPLTDERLRQYQRDNGLKPDGIAGPATWAKLKGAKGESKATKTEIIIHCTASREGVDLSVDDIRRMHKQRGFSDIGYNFVIYLDGSVHRGRRTDICGAHCLGHNRQAIGIVYVGGLDKSGKGKDTRTPEQKRSLVNLVAELRERYDIPKSNVYGHNEFANKLCPCFSVKQEFRES